MNDDRLVMMREYLDEWLDIFFKRPGIVGPPEVVNAIFYLYDGIDLILKYNYSMESSKKVSWASFLEMKGYFKDTKDSLHERLKQEEREDAYKLLQELRKEYYVWRTPRLEEGDDLS